MTRNQFATIEEDEPIDSQGTVIVERGIPGDTIVSLNIVGSAVADYALDVSADGQTWFGAEEVDSGTDIRDTFRLGDEYLRVRVTSAAANGETADVYVQEAR
jgi:hypothetical protein